MSAFGIIFTLVANTTQTSIIADCSRVKGQAVGVNAKKVFNSLPKNLAEKRSYNYDGQCYNIIYEGNICFMAVTDEGFNRVQCFAYLEELKKKYRQLQNDTDQLVVEMKKAMEFYSDPQNDKFEKVKRDMDNAKQAMLQNVDDMIERGDRIDNVVSKTDTLQQRSHKFQKQAVVLKKSMWKRNMCIGIAIALVLLIALVFIVTYACSEGGVNFKKCAGSNGNPKSNPGGNSTHAPSSHDGGNTKAPKGHKDINDVVVGFSKENVLSDLLSGRKHDRKRKL